jgi:hypothetical protein
VSLIRGYLNQVGQVKRTAPAVFFDGPAAASLSPLLITGIGGDSFKVKVQKSGGEAVTHTVTVTGTNGGSPVSNVLTFDYATQTKTTSSYFDTITSITTEMAGETPLPNIRAVAVDGGGAEITATTWEDFPCRWEEKATPYWNDLGEFILSDAKVMTEAVIEAGDFIRLYPDTGAGSEVKSMKPAVGLDGSEEFRTLLL